MLLQDAEHAEELSGARVARRTEHLAQRIRRDGGLDGEFVEADDELTLTVAHANAPHRALDPARIYNETEIGKNAG